MNKKHTKSGNMYFNFALMIKMRCKNSKQHDKGKPAAQISNSSIHRNIDQMTTILHSFGTKQYHVSYRYQHLEYTLKQEIYIK